MDETRRASLATPVRLAPAAGLRSGPELIWLKAFLARCLQHIAMEDEDQDVLAVARAAVLSFGADAPGIMEQRAEAHLHADEWEGAEFWQHVADAARTVLAARSAPCSVRPAG
jgi:hypothetical protein